MNNEKKLIVEDITKLDNKLLRSIVFAHSCADEDLKDLGYKLALNGLDRWQVSLNDVFKASLEWSKRRREFKKSLKINQLYLCCMGCDYDNELILNGINNHRVRGFFINNDGIKCFVEFGSGIDNKTLRIDHSIYNYDLKDKINNYENLERNNQKKLYNVDNVLNIVNENFNCSFEKLIVDYDSFLSPDEHISISKNQDLLEISNKLRFAKFKITNDDLFKLNQKQRLKYFENSFSYGYNDNCENRLTITPLDSEGWSNTINEDNLNILQYRDIFNLSDFEIKKIDELCNKFFNKVFYCRDGKTGFYEWHIFPTEDYNKCFVIDYKNINSMYDLELIEFFLNQEVF